MEVEEVLSHLGHSRAFDVGVRTVFVLVVRGMVSHSETSASIEEASGCHAFADFLERDFLNVGQPLEANSGQKCT